MRKIKRKRKAQNKRRQTARSEDFIMKPSVDWCFKELMRNPKTRKGFIAVLLQVKPEEIDETILLENELPKEAEEEKQGILGRTPAILPEQNVCRTDQSRGKLSHPEEVYSGQRPEF